MKRCQAYIPSAAVLLGLSLWLLPSSLVAQDDEPRTTRSRSASKALSSDEVAKLEKRIAQLEQKLEDVLANQQTILQRFDAVMEELRIIKVRATLRSG